MRRNKTFESICYKRSFLYFARYLEGQDPKYRDIFSNIDNSALNLVGDSSTFHRLKKREKIVIDKGAFLISGSISFKLVDQVRKVSLSRTSYNKFGLVPPCEYPMKAAQETLILKFKVEVLDYDIEGNMLINDDQINKSMISGSRMGLKKKTSIKGSLAGIMNMSLKVRINFK